MHITLFAVVVSLSIGNEIRSQECGNVVTQTSGTISYPRLTNLTEACQWILNISPLTKLRVGLRPLDAANNEAAVWIYRVNPENENMPLERAALVTQSNGTEVELIGTTFVIAYHEMKPEGKGFTLDFEGFEATTPTYSLQQHLIRHPTRTMSTSTYQFSPNQFTTILIRGPIYDNRMASYLKNVRLQYYELNENCGKCIMTISSLYTNVDSSYDIRSFYGSLKYPIAVKNDIFAPIVVTIDRRGDGIPLGLNFKLDWSYLT